MIKISKVVSQLEEDGYQSTKEIESSLENIKEENRLELKQKLENLWNFYLLTKKRRKEKEMADRRKRIEELVVKFSAIKTLILIQKEYLFKANQNYF